MSKDTMSRIEILADLRKCHFWIPIKQSLVGQDEIDYFEAAWVSYIQQFAGGGIQATDRDMIKDLIMLDINKMRADNEYAKWRTLVNQYERELENYDTSNLLEADPETKAMVKALRNDIAAAASASAAMQKQVTDWQKQKDAKMKDLKGTRDQRFKQQKEETHDVFMKIKSLAEVENRTHIGLEAEKIRIGIRKKAHEWAMPHEYADGIFDRPFLCPDVLEDVVEE